MKIKDWFNGHGRTLKKYEKVADEIIELETTIENLSDSELKEKTTVFKERLNKGETLDDILVEAFAVVREGARRVLGLHPYKVQIIGGLTLHDGNIAEMKTGEGKTLTATMPVYLNALAGKGVHVVTVNDYLASRDASEMGELYQFLGLHVGLNKQGMSHEDKKVAYNADITYSTNNELGFDYLRDNMASSLNLRVQRPLSFAIVDEVDSILIDEARTPLIISGKTKAAKGIYQRADFFVKGLSKEDYNLDIEFKTISLTEEGITKAEKVFRLHNLYDFQNQRLIHHIDKALQANFLMILDKDYVVDEGKIKIVDQFTGRIMEGRQYSDGLHQAIEAKENVEIQEETKTMASITFQNYFRMYEKLSGMTGTGKGEEEEFREVYNMNVICIETNKPLIREDREDLLYPTLNGKYKAVVTEIKRRHEIGQPVLVGTASVESSEYLGSLLKAENIPHQILNAKNHFKEAEIILDAGQPGAITIATNMAGRGTDIKVGPTVKELGGLAVIGTERHESRRIDDQLRGRSGRQGDPGVSQFYLSLEDDLMVRFGADKMKNMLQILTVDDEEKPLQSKLFSKQVRAAQERVEGNNYDSRKNVLQYDDVLREQREVIYKDRLKTLETEDTEIIMKGIQQECTFQLIKQITYGFSKDKWDLEKLTENCNNILNLKNIKIEDLKNKNEEELKQYIWQEVERKYEGKIVEAVGDIHRSDFERAIILRTVDNAWTAHIDVMDSLKNGISLRSYAQGDPLVEYQEEGYRLFEAMKWQITQEITKLSLHSHEY